MTETNAAAADAGAVFTLLPPIFRECVDRDGVASHRFFLRHPQHVGEFIYATDGRIAVRAAATPGRIAAVPPLPEGKRFIGPESLAGIFGERAAWHAGPTSLPSLSGFEKCGACGGSARLPERRCAGCILDHDDWEEDREVDCGGRGVIPAGPCPVCSATGLRRPRSRSVDLRPDVRLGLFYVAVLAKHGAAVYLPIAENTAGATTPIYFTVDGAEGVLMPMPTEARRDARSSAVVPAPAGGADGGEVGG